MPRLLSLIAAAILGSVITLAASHSFTQGIASSSSDHALTVRELRLVDDLGKTRAFLGMAEGEPRLYLYSTAGEPQISVGIVSSGPVLDMRRENMNAAIHLFVDEKGPRLGLDDPSGFVAINMASHKPGIVISRAEPKSVWKSPTQ